MLNILKNQSASKASIKRSSSIGLLLMMIVSSLPTQAQYQTQNSAPDGNQQYFIDGKPISRDKYDAFRLLNESVPLLQRNQNQEAADKLARAAQMAPQVAEIRNNLGLALAKLGRNNEALVELEQAKAQDRKSTRLNSSH